MQNLMRFALLIAVVLIILAPLVVDNRLSSKDKHYTETVLKYECVRDKCESDFDGDGASGSLVIDRISPPPLPSYSAHQAWLVVNDSERELLRLPFNYADGTLRTHVAIRSDMGPARLLVFDHTTQGTPLRQVFTWNGERMVQVEPSGVDEEILSALGARDDAGSWNDWALYRSLRVPILILYYGFLVGVVALLTMVRARKLSVRALRRDSMVN